MTVAPFQVHLRSSHNLSCVFVVSIDFGVNGFSHLSRFTVYSLQVRGIYVAETYFSVALLELFHTKMRLYILCMLH